MMIRFLKVPSTPASPQLSFPDPVPKMPRVTLEDSGVRWVVSCWRWWAWPGQGGGGGHPHQEEPKEKG